MKESGVIFLRIFTIYLFCGPLSVLIANGTEGKFDLPQKEKKTNVIVIMTDDQGYPELSIHANPILKTPNLDKLSMGIVRLGNFHSSPMCTPTRRKLITGMDAAENGLENGGESYINVEQAGTYKIELNRWPFHLNRKLNSKGPEFSIGGKSINQGKALDIAYGCMSIGNEEIKIQKAEQNSSVISFKMELEKGETQFRGWFMDNNKNNICGAYYVRFTKI